jgi:hypothetical protein
MPICPSKCVRRAGACWGGGGAEPLLPQQKHFGQQQRTIAGLEGCVGGDGILVQVGSRWQQVVSRPDPVTATSRLLHAPVQHGCSRMCKGERAGTRLMLSQEFAGAHVSRAQLVDLQATTSATP